MKIKTVVISLLVTAAAAGGIGYGIYAATRSKAKPVDVVPIQNVNFGYWGNSSTMYGSIISMDSQNVQLNSDYELVKVYVETGDEVKIGDPLLEYDMTLTELKNEMEELTKMGLEINLESLEKELKKLESTTPTASLELYTGTMTASDDGLLDENGSGQNGESFQSMEGQVQEASGNDAGDEELIINDGNDSEEENSGIDSGEAFPADDSMIIEDGSSDSQGDPIVSEEMITRINSFLTRVNQLSAQELDSLIASDISEALRIFR